MARGDAPQYATVKDSTTYFGPKYAGANISAGALQSGSVYPGGLDLLTPPLTLHPGAVRDILNFEVSLNGGYARIGRIRALQRTSDAQRGAAFAIVQVLTFVTVPSIGDQI